MNEHGGSIAFVEFIYALQNHLSYGRVRNGNGEFVPASLESIAAAASHSMKISRDFNVSIVDAPGAGVYPISSLTWIVVPRVAPTTPNGMHSPAFFSGWWDRPSDKAAALGYLGGRGH